MKYSGMAVQMGVIIGALAWGGLWLDQRWGCKPILTVVGSLFGVCLALYIFLREVLAPRPPDSNTPDSDYSKKK